MELVGELVGKVPTVEPDEARVRPDKSEVARLVSSPELARELTGWTPQVELRDGLARTIEWVERNTSRYRADEYVI